MIAKICKHNITTNAYPSLHRLCVVETNYNCLYPFFDMYGRNPSGDFVIADRVVAAAMYMPKVV